MKEKLSHTQRENYEEMGYHALTVYMYAEGSAYSEILLTSKSHKQSSMLLYM